MTRTPDEMRADAERAQALAEKATPGPWRQAHQRGYCIDYIVTDHAAFQTKPHDNYVGETGVGTGQPRQNFVEDAAFIAAARAAVPALASDVLSLLAERDTAYAHGVRAGLISAAEYLEHEAVLAKRDLRTGLYNSAALVCRSRAQVAAPEAEEIERRAVDAALERAAMWHDEQAKRQRGLCNAVPHESFNTTGIAHEAGAAAIRAMKGGGA